MFPQTQEENMIACERFQCVEVQLVWIDQVGRLEVVGGSIIRCRRRTDQTAMRTTAWSREEAELVSHVLRTVTPQRMQVECAWREKVFRVQVSRPNKRWVLRRRNGSVYQIHPVYAAAFARVRYLELLEREG